MVESADTFSESFDGFDGIKFLLWDLFQLVIPSLEGHKVFQDGITQIIEFFSSHLGFVGVVKVGVGIHRA